MWNDTVGNIFAKLEGLYKIVSNRVEGAGTYFDPPSVQEYFQQYAKLRDELKKLLPDLYSDLIVRDLPQSSGTTDFDGRGYIRIDNLYTLIRDIDYIFEVRKSGNFGGISEEKQNCIFISHGQNPDWLKVQVFIEKDLQIDTLELAQRPNKGRSVLQKLVEESNSCLFAVIVMTGDDEIEDDAPRVRENVMHEIGFFQGKYGLEKVCLLYEDGTNIPSNIHGLVYIPFPKGYINATFGALQREIKAVFI